jgi:hypothetical protein
VSAYLREVGADARDLMRTIGDAWPLVWRKNADAASERYGDTMYWLGRDWDGADHPSPPSHLHLA